MTEWLHFHFSLLSFIASCNFPLLIYLLAKAVVRFSSWWRILGIEQTRLLRSWVSLWVTVSSPFAPLTHHPLGTILCNSLCPERFTAVDNLAWLTCPPASSWAQTEALATCQRPRGERGWCNPMHLLPCPSLSPCCSRTSYWVAPFLWLWNMITSVLPATFHTFTLYPIKPIGGNSFPLLLSFRMLHRLL